MARTSRRNNRFRCGPVKNHGHKHLPHFCRGDHSNTPFRNDRLAAAMPECCCPAADSAAKNCLLTVQAGQEVTRDHLPRGPRSLQRGAALLCLLDRPQLWAHAAEFEGYQAGLRREMEGQQPPGVGQALPRRSPADTRVWPKVSLLSYTSGTLERDWWSRLAAPRDGVRPSSFSWTMAAPSEYLLLCREGMHEVCGQGCCAALAAPRDGIVSSLLGAART